ncbi:hypothetical protein [Halorhodospira halophila]|uniref:hypothetical protein n=1 Tax=Halorhodospira halophila TaxID=1053 RepID=UPI0019115AAF|nr:hypothetical protein [Halorhodospira halophila]
MTRLGQRHRNCRPSCLGDAAMLGGYIRCNSDPPPGHQPMGQGYSKLAYMTLGYAWCWARKSKDTDQAIVHWRRTSYGQKARLAGSRETLLSTLSGPELERWHAPSAASGTP